MCDSHYIYYKTNRNVPSLKLGWAALPSSKDMSSKSIAKRAANDMNLEACRMTLSIKSYIYRGWKYIPLRIGIYRDEN